jgi:hypothetical protein
VSVPQAPAVDEAHVALTELLREGGWEWLTVPSVVDAPHQVLCAHCEFWPALAICHGCSFPICATCIPRNPVCPMCWTAWANGGEQVAS